MLNFGDMRSWLLLSATAILIFALSSSVEPQTQSAPSGDSSIAAPAAKDSAKVMPPRVVHAPDPEYPEEASRAGHQGTCVVSLTVGADGHSHDVRIVRRLTSELDDAAVSTVRTWRYDPALKDGKPVDAQIKVEIKFRLRGGRNDKIAKLWDQADKSDPKAYLEISKMYFKGRGAPQDEQLGIQFLKMAADWNFPEAQFQMGERFYKSQDGAPDYDSAYMWYALSKRGGYKKGEEMLKVLAKKMSADQLSEAETRVDYWPEDPPKQP